MERKLQDLYKVCAVIDAQGFTNEEGNFVPREIGVVGNDFSDCYEINPNLEEFSNTRFFNKYLTEKIHGLSIKPISRFCTRLEDLEFLIDKIYNIFSTEEQPYFACKNNQLLKLLIDFQIPTIDLDNQIFYCPPVRELEGPNIWFCRYHTNLPRLLEERKHFRCAQRKADNLWNWINRRLANLNNGK